MPRRILAVVAATMLLLAACGQDKVENYELSTYDLAEGTFEYTVELTVTGNAELGAIETFLGSSAGDASDLDFSLTATATLTVAKEGANNVLEMELSGFDGRLPFGADYPNETETYELTVTPDGEVVDSSTDGLLAVVPGVASIFGFNCPPLTGEPMQSGDSWTGEATPPYSDGDETWETENRWKDTDVDGTQAAEITSNVDQDFSTEIGLGEVVELLGLETSVLSGVTATADGHVALATTCDLSIPDQELLRSGGTNKVDVSLSVDAGSGVAGQIAALVSGVSLDLTVEGSMTPK